MDKLCAAIAAAVLACMASWPSFAADTGLRGFNIQHFHQSSDMSGVHSLYGTRTLGTFKPALRLTVNSAGRLARVGNALGGRFNIVDTTIIGDLSAAIGLGKYVDVGMIMPFVLLEDEMDVNTLGRAKRMGFGDLLLDAKVRLVEDRPRRIGLGIMSRLSVPTGDQKQFTGWGKPAGEFRLILDKTINNFYATTNVGYRVMSKVNVVNVASGVPWNFSDDDRLTFGGGARYSLPIQKRSWDIQASLYGENVIGNSNELSTPIEIDAGIVKRFANGMSVEAGGGYGITNALGSPSYRAFLAVGFDAGKRTKSVSSKMPPSEIKAPVQKTILFSFDDATVHKDSKIILESVAANLKGREGITVSIEGHTDSTGARSYNRALGLRRARAVANVLIAMGVDSRLFKVSSCGALCPADSNSTREGRQKNRRVEIKVEISP